MTSMMANRKGSRIFWAFGLDELHKLIVPFMPSANVTRQARSHPGIAKCRADVLLPIRPSRDDVDAVHALHRRFQSVRSARKMASRVPKSWLMRSTPGKVSPEYTSGSILETVNLSMYDSSLKARPRMP